MSEELDYAAAGVDVHAGEKAVELMRASISAAQRPETRGDFGGFVGLFDASALARYEHPLLATSTDGVGTKIVIAQMMDKHDTIGIDLVAMIVDDIVVCGAEPLFLTDYIACGKVQPSRIAAIVSGIATGCQMAGAALLGGETAEHPGIMGEDEYDLAAAGTGVVEAANLRSAELVHDGDVIIAMRSSGLHSNGYSLARAALLDVAGMKLSKHLDDLGRTLGEELLEPTRIYTKDCLALCDELGGSLRVFSHITGGGIAANVARVLPAHLHADLDRSTWTPHPIFSLIGSAASVSPAAQEQTFNMGLGMVAVVDPRTADAALRLLAARGIDAWVCATIRVRRDGDVSGSPAKGGRGGSVTLVGMHSS